ncbi:MAG: type II toxin-antitoxin system PemK/MazF family toxin [Erysipelotrichaceae bacterium]
MMVNRGDVYYADLSPIVGSEQGGVRPVVVIQNDKGNTYSKTIIIAPISKKMSKPPLPTHVIFADEALDYVSMILLEQVRTIDKKRLTTWICKLDIDTMEKINEALKISLGL